MARFATLSNGSLLVNYSRDFAMKEVYYPFVGMDAQTGPTGHLAYIWCESGTARLGDHTWPLSLRYAEDTLVLEASGQSEAMRLAIQVRDAVHHARNVFLREVVVQNLSESPRTARFLLGLDTCLRGDDVGDTAMFDPHSHGILHFKRAVFMLANGHGTDSGGPHRTTGTRSRGSVPPDVAGTAGGALSDKPVSQGSVYSILSVDMNLPGGGAARGYVWIAFASSLEEVRALDAWVKDRGPGALIASTEAYWRAYLSAAVLPPNDLPVEATSLYKRSILTVRAECDNTGAVIAANDRDMLEQGRDHYSYVWPRDGALVSVAMLRAGFWPVTRRFLEFCAQVALPEGFLWHRYHPDGSLGSTWHPWLIAEPPIQEDETALTIWALGKYIEATRDVEFLKSVFGQYLRMADFLVAYVHAPTGLPLPSRDLWEERHGVFTFTVAAVCSALDAIAGLSTMLGLDARAALYSEVKQKMAGAWRRLMLDQGQGRFVRGIYLRGDGMVLDPTADSSLHGMWMFGLLPAIDPQVAATLDWVESTLAVSAPAGGYARYTGDYYFRRTDDIGLAPGNPWIVCTLWAASRHALIAENIEMLAVSRELLMWAVRKAGETGMLAEQVDPMTGEPLSVAPLTWSHATFIDTYLDYAQAYARLAKGR